METGTVTRLDSEIASLHTPAIRPPARRRQTKTKFVKECQLKTLDIQMSNLVATLCIGAAALLITGCLDIDDNGQDRDELAGGSLEASTFASLAGNWEGTGLNLGGEVEAWSAQVVIGADGMIEYIHEGFILLENLSPEVVQDRVYSYVDQEGQREYVQLVNPAGTHALGMTRDGRPIVLEKDGVASTFQADAVVGAWTGEMFAVEDFPPRLVDRRGNVRLVVDSQGVSTVDVPGLCEGVTIEALEQRLDPGFGQNFWITQGLIDGGVGSDCPTEPSFARVIMSPDETHIGVSICDQEDEAANGCGLFLLKRETTGG